LKASAERAKKEHETQLAAERAERDKLVCIR